MRKRMPDWGLLWVLALGCSPPKAVDQDIVRPGLGEPLLEKLPGPVLPPFDSLSDALIAACGKILSKPNAVAGRRDRQNFDTYWRVSSEYCAWIYYTPDRKYELSKLTDQSRSDPLNRDRKCLLPSFVDDSRYPEDQIKYICALHNHLFDDGLSAKDLGFIVSEIDLHGYESQTKDGAVQLSAVAFFSNDNENPRCDGFYQYIPATSKIVKWTQSKAREWKCEQTGRVTWHDARANVSIEEVRLPCFKERTP